MKQYTLRNVPAEVDQALRRLARERHKSLNQVAVETLEQAVGTAAPSKRRDLSDLMGTWKDDPETAAALADQRRVDSPALATAGAGARGVRASTVAGARRRWRPARIPRRVNDNHSRCE